MITIVDYGLGNLGSLRNMFARLGVETEVESDPEGLRRAARLLLPGVGAFDAAMERINGIDGLREVLDDKALVQRVPVLGVCLGMQLLTDGSEEGSLPGLGWIPGKARRFARKPGLRVPHMGWNVARTTGDAALTRDLGPEPRFYFVHSYHVHTVEPDDSLMKTTYDVEFDSAIGRDNVAGVQFHPEKSHRFGMKVLGNFAGV